MNKSRVAINFNYCLLVFIVTIFNFQLFAADKCEFLFENTNINTNSSKWVNFIFKAPIIGRLAKISSLKNEITISNQDRFNSLKWNYWIIQTASSEFITIMNDSKLDPDYYSWVVSSPIFKKPGLDNYSKMKLLRKYVRDTFANKRENLYDLYLKEWRFKNLIGSIANERYDFEDPIDQAYIKIGDFIKIKRGVCRHQAAGLISILQTEGISARYVSGNLIFNGQTHPHAWVIAKSEFGEEFLLDSAIPLDEPQLLPNNSSGVISVSLNGIEFQYIPNEDQVNGKIRPIDIYDDFESFF